MIEEGFSRGESIIHRLDPRVRIFIACVFSIITAVSNRFPTVLFALIVGFILICIAGLSLKKVFSRLLVINLFILLFWFFIPFTMEGNPVFTLGSLAASKEGVRYAALITVKSNSIIFSLMALAATIPVFTIGKAMRHLFIPKKIVHLFLFTYRYIHAIHREYLKLKDAMDIRGFRPSNNTHTYRSYAYLIGMLLVKSHDRAERVRSAMMCRGFKGNFYTLSDFSLGPADLFIFLILLLAVSVIGLLEWTTIIY